MFSFQQEKKKKGSGLSIFEEHENQLDFLNKYLGANWMSYEQSLLVKERNKTQRTLKGIETGRKFNFRGIEVTASSWRTRPPEIITGRY